MSFAIGCFISPTAGEWAESFSTFAAVVDVRTRAARNLLPALVITCEQSLCRRHRLMLHFAPPPDCPKIVTFDGSPPNSVMLFGSISGKHQSSNTAFPRFGELLSADLGEIEVSENIEPMGSLSRQRHHLVCRGECRSVRSSLAVPLL